MLQPRDAIAAGPIRPSAYGEIAHYFHSPYFCMVGLFVLVSAICSLDYPDFTAYYVSYKQSAYICTKPVPVLTFPVNKKRSQGHGIALKINQSTIFRRYKATNKFVAVFVWKVVVPKGSLWENGCYFNNSILPEVVYLPACSL
jgi:hypothetical protein